MSRFSVSVAGDSHSDVTVGGVGVGVGDRGTPIIAIAKTVTAAAPGQ